MASNVIISSFDPDIVQGDGVVDFNIMFSGKTFRISQMIDTINDINKHRSNRKLIRYAVINNSIDRSVREGTTFSRRTGEINALTIPRDNPLAALEKIRELDKTGGFRDVIAWDELHYMNLDVLPIILEFQKEGRAQWFSGLDTDFRKEPYFLMTAILKLFKYRIKSRATCTFEEANERCSDPAVQNIRMVQNFVAINEREYPNTVHGSFYKKDNGSLEIVITDYAYAPYWQRTVLVRGTPGIEYTVACAKHSCVPRANETKIIFDYIQKQRVTTIEKIKNEGFSNMPDLEDILKFLVTERNIKYDNEKKLYSFK